MWKSKLSIAVKAENGRSEDEESFVILAVNLFSHCEVGVFQRQILNSAIRDNHDRDKRLNSAIRDNYDRDI